MQIRGSKFNEELVNLRLTWGRCLAGVVVVLALATGCSGSDDEPKQGDTVAVATNAPGYCQQLSKLPVGLQAAVANAAAGNATEADKSTINSAITQLRGAADAQGVPEDLRTKLRAAADTLGKLAKGETLTEAEATNLGTTFQNLGKAVEEKCASK